MQSHRPGTHKWQPLKNSSTQQLPASKITCSRLRHPPERSTLIPITSPDVPTATRQRLCPPCNTLPYTPQPSTVHMYWGEYTSSPRDVTRKGIHAQTHSHCLGIFLVYSLQYVG